LFFFFFFFKQKTAYEISARDWSSDVCSSDLIAEFTTQTDAATARRYDLQVPYLAVNWDFVLTPA